MFLLATYLNLNLGLYWLRIAKHSWKYNSFFGSLLLSILCTWPSKIRFFSMRISAIDGIPAHWLERRSDLHPVRVPRPLILTEGVAPPGLNTLSRTLTNWYNRYKVVWLVVQLTCSITSDRSATPVKTSVIAQPEQKPCKCLTIITSCHLPRAEVIRWTPVLEASI